MVVRLSSPRSASAASNPRASRHGIQSSGSRRLFACFCVSAMARSAAVLLVALCLLGSGAVDAKRCVFLHGAGQDPSTVGPPTPTDTDKYWGDVTGKYAPAACDSFVFNHDDTVTQAFDDPVLMDNYCKVATDGTGTVTNSIVL